MKWGAARGAQMLVATVLVFPAIATGVIAYWMAGVSDLGGSDAGRMRIEIAQLRAEITSLRGRVGELQEKVRTSEKRLAELHEPKIVPLSK
jgi:uncharacterized protein YlxW (UPF0749 family)